MRESHYFNEDTTTTTIITVRSGSCSRSGHRNQSHLWYTEFHYKRLSVLMFTFNLWLSQNFFLICGNKQRVFPLKKSSSVGNYRPTAILNFSQVFEFIIHDHVSLPFSFLSKLNSSQHRSTESTSTFTNLLTFLDTVTLLLWSKDPSVYFVFSTVFDIIPHETTA
jgi:hypothetical protein